MENSGIEHKGLIFILSKITKSLPYLLLIVFIIWAVWQGKELRQPSADTRSIAESVSAAQEQQEALQSKVEEQGKQITEISQSVSEMQSRLEAVEFKANPDIPLPDDLQEHIHNEAQRIGIDPAILYALMYRESRYQVDAYCMDTNGYEAVGLCQINGMAFDFLTERGIDWTTPEGNITAACELYAYYRYELGCTPLEAWAAYGAGYQGMRSGRGFEAARELIERANELEA